MKFEPGEIIDERYLVGAFVGSGGMASVYLATDLRDQREVALKIMQSNPEKPDLAGRFLRGARLARRIQHPHVTRTFDVGQWGDPPSGHYITMEYVSGVSFSELLDASLPRGAIIQLVCQVLTALAHVHAHGVLHRDIKPDNILVYLSNDGTLKTKLTDFGIAAALRPDLDENSTDAGTIVGTPAYMAPEQVRRVGGFGPPTDLYAVGTILYRALAGRLPFDKTGVAILVARVIEPPEPLTPRAGTTLPQGLTDIVMRLLNTSPVDRYQAAADAMRHLAPYCAPAKLTQEQWTALTAEVSELSPASHGGPLSRPLDAMADTAISREPVFDGHTHPTLPTQSFFWGREQLMLAVEKVVARAEHGEGQVALLSGVTGIGKSCVIDKVSFALAERGRFFVLRALRRQDGGIASALRHALEQYLGIVGRSVSTVRGVVKSFLERHQDVEPHEYEELVTFLRPQRQLDADGSVDALNVCIAVTIRALRRISVLKPVLLVVDDIAMCGVEGVRFLSHILFEIRRQAFPVLCLAAFSIQRSDAAFEAALAKNDREIDRGFHQLVVPALGLDELAHGLMDQFGLDQSVAVRVANAADGNPLFAVHLARGGAEDLEDSLQTSSSLGEMTGLPRQLARVLKLSFTESLAKTTEPETLRELCLFVAILGGGVRVEILRQFASANSLEVDLDLALDELIEAGLMVEEPVYAEERVFLHPKLLRELLSSEVSLRRRRRLHRSAAAVRMDCESERLDAEAGVIAHHFDQAGDNEEAVKWWRRSVPYEAQVGHPTRAVESALCALGHMDRSSVDYATLAVTAGQLLLDLGDLERAEDVLGRVVSSSDADAALRAGDLLADVYENAGRGDKWAETIEAMSAREADAGPLGLTALYCARSMWLNSQGERDRGFEEAQKAVDCAEGGPDTQRAAQRLVYTSLTQVKLQLGEEAAKRALAHSGSRPELKARSLRALGVVLMWQHKPAAAIEKFEAVVNLAQRQGLLARLPIAWHDLGDARRIGGALKDARAAYDKAIDSARELNLTSSVMLIQFKLFLCDIVEGKTEGLAERIAEATPQAMASGLSLAVPFANMMLAWFHAREGRLRDAQLAYSAVADMRINAIDPQFPVIMEEIGRAVVTSKEASTYRELATESLSLGMEYWARYGQSERAKACESLFLQFPGDA